MECSVTSVGKQWIVTLINSGGQLLPTCLDSTVIINLFRRTNDLVDESLIVETPSLFDDTRQQIT